MFFFYLAINAFKVEDSFEEHENFNQNEIQITDSDTNIMNIDIHSGSQIEKLKIPGACDVCMFVLKLIKKFGRGSTKKGLKRIIRKSCSLLSFPLKQVCSLVIKTLSGLIISKIDEHVDLDRICGLIHVCPKRSFIDLLKFYAARGNTI